MKKLQLLIEQQYFGVCTSLSDKLGVSTSSVRLFFIYFSFITYGSPLVVYLGLAFLMNIKRSFRKRRSYFYDI